MTCILVGLVTIEGMRYEVKLKSPSLSVNNIMYAEKPTSNLHDLINLDGLV